MNRIITIPYGSNACEALQEEKNRFLRAMIEIAGIDVSSVWKNNIKLTNEIEAKLDILLKNNDFYYSNQNTCFEVFLRNKLFGRMEVINKKLRMNRENKQVYLDITVEFTVNEEPP